ncbi:DUF6233 domain-containing protein [Streptomyces sp. NPDC002589]|uniref:DUF6233 domain-containing protein n=1 Tax=Streptomyces sp. NPDC002589 TaxID=3154420 RepID=UPI00332B11A8
MSSKSTPRASRQRSTDGSPTKNAASGNGQGEAALPAPPDWILDCGRTRDALPVAVHTGGCTMTGKRSNGVDSDTARRALASGVKACTFCRPDTELGILD